MSRPRAMSISGMKCGRWRNVRSLGFAIKMLRSEVGATDASAWFVIAASDYVQASGDEHFRDEVRPMAERAIAWLRNKDVEIGSGRDRCERLVRNRCQRLCPGLGR